MIYSIVMINSIAMIYSIVHSHDEQYTTTTTTSSLTEELENDPIHPLIFPPIKDVKLCELTYPLHKYCRFKYSEIASICTFLNTIGVE